MSERTLQAAVAALLGIEDEAQARRVAARTADVAERLPQPAGQGIRAGMAALDLASRMIAGRPLAALSPAERDWVATTMAGRGGGPLLDALKMPVLFAAGAVRFADVNGGSAPDGNERPDPPLDCTPSAEWPSRAVADAVVIGSGAGGAMAARTLARSGANVIIIEAGRRYAVSEFRDRQPLDRFLDLYGATGADAGPGGAWHPGAGSAHRAHRWSPRKRGVDGLTVAVGRPPVLLMAGHGVGGTTLVNSGTCYRTPARVVTRWRQPFGIDMDGFGALLDEVEQTLQVAQAPLDVLGPNGLIALAGADKLGWRAEPLRRNAPGCGGSCQCAVGCPRNAKNGVHLNALPQACASGARIVTHAWAERILTEHGPGGRRAAGVQVVRPNGSVLEILAPIVVVAAGALHTPLLLRRSGLGGHRSLGRGLAIHPALSVAGRFDERVLSWTGVLQSAGIEELHDQGILIEATASPPGMSSFVLPGVGRALRRELDQADRLAFLGAMIADAPSGSVYGRHRPVVRYRLAPRDAAALRTAAVAMGRVLFAAGAREVLSGLPGRPAARDTPALAGLVAAAPVSAMHLAAFHPTGTARMGADPQRCPVDEEGRLRGAGGVWVADASVLPTCPEVNPQLTIMAMALAVAGRCSRAG
ncbi:MAG: GMC family oxidoreductase N-terminal domain-containing protein [Micromonosporaceae bacterium]